MSGVIYCATGGYYSVAGIYAGRFSFIFSPIFSSLSKARVGSVLKMVFGCPLGPSVPLPRTEEIENKSIEEHSRRLWHFCRH